jgi:hypothetical protein
MMPRLRSLSLPALLAVSPLAIAALAGCTSASSTLSPATSSSVTAGNSAGPATTPASAVAAGSSPATAGRKVFLAEGGDVRGPTVYEPGCDGAGCGLSGDGTTALFNMTWTTWNATEAVGTGTEKIDDCNPNCAAGTLHAIAVRVTLSDPVLVCQPSAGAWYWTRVTFVWPDGLPAVFAGDNAPTNPFSYPGITAQQATSCS